MVRDGRELDAVAGLRERWCRPTGSRRWSTRSGGSKAKQTGLLESLQILEDRALEPGDASAADAGALGQGPGAGRSELRSWARRSRRWRNSPGAAKTFPAGCIMKC